MAAVDIFADVGVDLWHEGRLADGIHLLAERLEHAGAGDLLRQIMAVEFTDADKRDPKPVPTPKPPVPPKPPLPKGWRS